MSLQDALHAARHSHRPDEEAPCTMCLVIEHSPIAERAALEEAAAGKIAARALHRILRDNGLRVSREVINRHRNEAHRVDA